MRISYGIAAGLIIIIVAVVACGPSPNAAAPHPTEQVAWGEQLFGQHCAKCHGDQGRGTSKAPPLVGTDALPLNPPPTAKHRTTQFHTAADVFAFVEANMPADEPGSLTDDEYAAILAFDLKANGVDLDGKHVDASTAPSFVLHP